MNGEQYQEPYQPQQIQENVNLAGTSHDYSNLLMFCLDTNEIIQELQHQLKNEIYDNKNDKYIVLGDPLLNEKGISHLISITRPMVDRTITLSTFDNEEINRKMQEFGHNLVRLLARHYKEFGIPNLIVSSNIRVLICNLVHSSLKKAKGALTLNAIKMMEKRVESSIEKPKGFLKTLLPNV
jgi:hypothetical protein